MVTAERKQREKDIEEAREEEEKSLRDEMEKMKLSGPVSVLADVRTIPPDFFKGRRWSCCTSSCRWAKVSSASCVRGGAGAQV